MLKGILMVALFVIIILFSFRLLVFNENFYLNEAEKLNTFEHREKYLNMINYLKDDEPLRSFNEKESLHMKDVKNLIDKTLSLWRFLIISAAISIYFVYKKQYRNIVSLFQNSAIFTIIALSILSILLLTSFNTSFIYFHRILFNNELWLLDSSTDLLINLFPKQFFTDFMKKLIINSYFISIIILLFTLTTKTLKKKKLHI